MEELKKVLTDEEVTTNIEQIKSNVQDVLDNVDPEEVIQGFNELVENVSSVDKLKETLQNKIDNTLADLAIDINSLSTLIGHMKALSNDIDDAQDKAERIRMGIMLNNGVDSVNSLLKSIPELNNEIFVLQETLKNIH